MLDARTDRPRLAGLGEVLKEWGRIGVIGFGGPPAHIALLRELVVDRRRWLDAKEFEDANAACGLLPGPASTQMAIYCAQRAAGIPGALVGGVAFIVPGLIMIIALAAASLSGSPPRWLLGLGAGAGAAVVPVVLNAGWTLARSSIGGRRGAQLARALVYLTIGTGVTVLAGAWVVLALLACGLAELAVRRQAAGGGDGVRAGIHAWPVWPAFAALAAATGTSQLPALAWTAFKVGALSYGGGFVIIPLMQADAVDAYHWMTNTEFLNAVAFGQLTPGPVVQTVAVVGYAAAGLGGAVLAAVVAFAPSFLVIGIGAERFERLRGDANARAFLDGAGPAAIGAIIGAVVPLAEGLEEWWQVGVLAAAVVLAFLFGPLWALLAGAVAGVVAALVGAPIPGA